MEAGQVGRRRDLSLTLHSDTRPSFLAHTSAYFLGDNIPLGRKVRQLSPEASPESSDDELLVSGARELVEAAAAWVDRAPDPPAAGTPQLASRARALQVSAPHVSLPPPADFVPEAIVGRVQRTPRASTGRLSAADALKTDRAGERCDLSPHSKPQIPVCRKESQRCPAAWAHRTSLGTRPGTDDTGAGPCRCCTYLGEPSTPRSTARASRQCSETPAFARAASSGTPLPPCASSPRTWS